MVGLVAANLRLGARPVAFGFGCLRSWDKLSKNRFEHIHVRFSPAIHGLRNFWKAYPNYAV